MNDNLNQKTYVSCTVSCYRDQKACNVRKKWVLTQSVNVGITMFARLQTSSPVQRIQYFKQFCQLKKKRGKSDVLHEPRPSYFCISQNIQNTAWKYVVGSKSFRPDIQKPRQMENAVRDI